MEPVPKPTMPPRRVTGAAMLLLGAFAAAADLSIVVVDRDGTRVENAVVTVQLKSAATDRFRQEAEVASVAQAGQQFSPRVTAVKRGTSIRFPNRDITQHHVYSFSPAKTFE